jgi:hypothetical protein
VCVFIFLLRAGVSNSSQPTNASAYQPTDDDNITVDDEIFQQCEGLPDASLDEDEDEFSDYDGYNGEPNDESDEDVESQEIIKSASGKYRFNLCYRYTDI